MLVHSGHAQAGELAWAIQAVGVPCVLAFDEVMLEYWRREGHAALLVLDFKVPWAKELAPRLVRQGLQVVALSDDDEERLAAINAGFAEALPSHLPVREIAARLRARFVARDEPQTIQAGELEGPLKVELARRRATWWGREVELTPVLFDLAAYFASRPGVVVSVKTLLRDLWHEPWAHPDKVHKSVWRLREALGPDATAYLTTKGRHGYCYFPG